MQTAHLKALKDKHERLEKSIHTEQTHVARNSALIEKLKKEKLHLKEEIARYEERSA